MFRALFQDGALLDLPVVSMLAFFALFAGVLVWTASRRRRSHYDRMSQLPLDD
jgi:hypothetical protein